MSAPTRVRLATSRRNGTRTAALDITSDGAHIIDPGCNCGQAMNTNADMTAELKVMTSNFGADESKGPVTISAYREVRRPAVPRKLIFTVVITR